MVKNKLILCVLLFTISSIGAMAQTYDLGSNNTNSPYTRYGFGELSNQGFANSRAMGGVAYGLRSKYHINPVNPASYTAVDSLTFLFDAGISLQNTNFDDGTTKLNAKNSSFDYVAMQFRLFKGMGMTIGLIPYSNVGYSISNYNEVKEEEGASNLEKYEGDGGLRQAFLGVGYNVFNGLSVGANISYLWGDINRYRTVLVTGTGAYNYSDATYLSFKDYKLDFGAQYTRRIGKKKELTLGLTFSPGKKLNNDASIYTEKTITDASSGSLSVVESNKRDTVATFEIPVSFGIGLAYVYDNRLTVGLDYSLQKWGDVNFMNKENAFSDRSKISLGVEYLPSYTGRSYFSHIKYRFGAYYSEPYYKMEREDGSSFRAAKEYGVTAGLSLPVPRTLSSVNLSAQYIRVDGQKSNMLNENYLRICIGVTFNERWFVKRKVR